MAGRRSKEQAMTWLRSMAADKNSLDGINAELCLNLIEDQQKKLDRLGTQFNHVRNERNAMREDIEELRNEKQWLEENCVPDFSRLTREQRELLEKEGIELVEF